MLHVHASGSCLDRDDGGAQREEAAAREPAANGCLGGHDARAVTAEAAPLHQRKEVTMNTTHNIPYTTIIQFLWQDDAVNVFKFPCECLDVMLVADSDDQSETSDQR